MSFAVAAAIGGIEESNPCGMSTHTSGRSRSSRNDSVSSTLRSSSHDLVAEFDRDPVVRESRDCLLDVGLVLPRDREVLRELEQDGAELAGGVQRVEGEPEALPHLVHRVVGELVAVEATLVEELLRELGLDVAVERVGTSGVVREEGVRLDVEREVLGRALDPELRVPLGRWEVVRRVDLDQRELGGVELEPSFRRLRPRGVEVAVLDERGIRPRRRADQDAHRSLLQPSSPHGSSWRRNLSAIALAVVSATSASRAVINPFRRASSNSSLSWISTSPDP